MITQIFARIRPIPDPMSPASAGINITMLNDTGSTAQSVFDSDVLELGLPNNYVGYGPETLVTTANGVVPRRRIAVEVQLLTPQGGIASDWIREYGVLTPSTPGSVRLSGSGIRGALYFATAPGNEYLYVAAKKNGIIDQLPVV